MRLGFRPLAIDLYAGLGGWSEGLIAEGWDVIGFDIERHVYGDKRYPAQLVLQNVLTLHGSQFKHADLIVGSSPCQRYSYMAMPFSRGKQQAAEIRADTTGNKLRELNALFDAQFRIQQEACAAAGRHIPIIVENVRGAIPWVGRSRWNFGSFHLWGDVPALMLLTAVGIKGIPHRPAGHWTNPQENGTKQGGVWFNAEQPSISRMCSSKSKTRKAASAEISKIPFPLAAYIGRTFYPC